MVTNYHVISGGITGGALPKSVRVKTQGMLQGVEAAVVGVEPDKEIALTSTLDPHPRPPPETHTRNPHPKPPP